MPGDERYGCRTMPIVWGVNATKVYIAVWMIILTAVSGCDTGVYLAVSDGGGP